MALVREIHYSNTTRTGSRRVLLSSSESVCCARPGLTPLTCTVSRTFSLNFPHYSQGAVQKKCRLCSVFFLLLLNLWLTKSWMIITARYFPQNKLGPRRLCGLLLLPLQPFPWRSRQLWLLLRVAAFLFFPDMNFLCTHILDTCAKAWCQSDCIRTPSNIIDSFLLHQCFKSPVSK